MKSLPCSGEVQQALSEKLRSPIPQLSSTPLVITRAVDEDGVAQRTPVTVKSKVGNTEAVLEKEKSQPQSVEPDTYVHGVKLVIITVCVALSVLLVALVSRIELLPSFVMSGRYPDTNRTTP
jgi:hypothetical protein